MPHTCSTMNAAHQPCASPDVSHVASTARETADAPSGATRPLLGVLLADSSAGPLVTIGGTFRKGVRATGSPVWTGM